MRAHRFIDAQGLFHHNRCDLIDSYLAMLITPHRKLFEPLPGTPSTHILKPNHPGEDYPASVMNDFPQPASW